MMTMAGFTDVTATRRCGTLRVYLNRHSVGPVIADDFGADFCALPFRRKERIDITFSFLAGYPGPTAFDGDLELIEIGVSHTEIP